jgi:hypothetical protein
MDQKTLKKHSKCVNNMEGYELILPTSGELQSEEIWK